MLLGASCDSMCTWQVTAVPMRPGLRPESRTQSGVSLRFEGSRAPSAAVVPMRQPSRQLSGSFPAFVRGSLDGRHCSISSLPDTFNRASCPSRDRSSS